MMMLRTTSGTALIAGMWQRSRTAPPPTTPSLSLSVMRASSESGESAFRKTDGIVAKTDGAIDPAVREQFQALVQATIGEFGLDRRVYLRCVEGERMRAKIADDFQCVQISSSVAGRLAEMRYLASGDTHEAAGG